MPQTMGKVSRAHHEHVMSFRNKLERYERRPVSKAVRLKTVEVKLVASLPVSLKMKFFIQRVYIVNDKKYVVFGYA